MEFVLCNLILYLFLFFWVCDFCLIDVLWVNFGFFGWCFWLILFMWVIGIILWIWWRYCEMFFFFWWIGCSSRFFYVWLVFGFFVLCVRRKGFCLMRCIRFSFCMLVFVVLFVIFIFISIRWCFWYFYGWCCWDGVVIWRYVRWEVMFVVVCRWIILKG